MVDVNLANEGQSLLNKSYNYSKQEVLTHFQKEDSSKKTFTFGHVVIDYMKEEDKFYISIDGHCPKEISLLRTARYILPPKN